MSDDLLRRRAEFVYEACRLHAKHLGCPVVPAPLEDRDPAFREQFYQVVGRTINGERVFRSAKEAHDNWCRKHYEMGWKYGPVYDPDNKVHPDLVPFDDLDPKEKIKDTVFLVLVGFASKYIW